MVSSSDSFVVLIDVNLILIIFLLSTTAPFYPSGPFFFFFFFPCYQVTSPSLLTGLWGIVTLVSE
jgi:hypothetical protein